MKLFKQYFLMVALVLSASLPFAQSGFAQESDYKALTAKLGNRLGFDIESISDAPVNGLIQLNTSRGIFYASEDGGYLLQARIFNLNEGMRNETEEALTKIRLDGVESFRDDMIEFKADDEKYVVSVFTDITCGYCRKLHEQIQDYNDAGITVRYMAFPRAGLESPTYNQMVSVWCADNPQKAMTDAKSDSQIASASCANKVAEEYKFGQKVGVSGTPSIVLEDGSLIPGYQPPALLLQALQSAS